VETNRLIIAAAVAGWALFGFSVLGPWSSEADVQTEIERQRQAADTNAADRDALAGELEQFKDQHQNLQHLQKQIAAATEELKHLEYLRGRISGEIDTMRPQPSGASTPRNDDGSATVESIPLSKDEISSAQEALARLGYGSLKADGALGPGTRRVIEAFQKKQGLPVTGRLGADTLSAIKSSRTSARP
jgi:septal ring factor EnvC (AmiA/AmiB activator)